MPWTTPTLKEVRSLTRDFVTAALGARSLIPNSVLRIMADVNAGLSHLVLLYIDWVAKQMLPDTAETEWLGRHGTIWLKNADGTYGRKEPAVAEGTVTMIATTGTVPVPLYTQLSGPQGLTYQTTQATTVSTTATPVPVEALLGGSDGNLEVGDLLTLVGSITNLDNTATVVELLGGTDEEDDDDLRARVLFRIRNPPMGGDKADYEIWATQVPGVTRAWCAPLEMGIGTVTVRFMMDDLRANGLPLGGDIETVTAYLETVRPVAVKDFFVVAPLPFYYNISIGGLVDDSEAVRAAIEASIKAMERVRTAPGVTMYRSWVDEAISAAVGEDHHELIFQTTAMPSPGHLAILGTIVYF